MGLQDHYFTPSQIYFRTRRTIGLGKDIVFCINNNINFKIKREALHAFKFFSKSRKPEPEMKLFLKLAKNKKCLLDAGALYGVYSLTFTAEDKTRKAYAVDPSPVAFRTLQYHTKINPELKIKPYELGLGNKEGKLKMKYEWVHLSIVNEKDKDWDYSARIATIDNFVKENKICPDILKIDTEGSEYNILQGGRKFLKKHKPLIFLEIHIHWLKNIGISAEKIFSLIKSLGYEVYDENLKPVKKYEALLKKGDNFKVICCAGKDLDLIKSL